MATSADVVEIIELLALELSLAEKMKLRDYLDKLIQAGQQRAERQRVELKD